MNIAESVPNRPAFHIMTKPRGAICNLGCKYCYFLKKEALYPDSDFRMSEATLSAFTRQYIESQGNPEVTFAWQGGEPTLMGLGFFEKAVALQKKYRRPGMQIHNALQTNGTTLDDDWCRFLRQNNFLVGLSLDGPRRMHDAYRVDKRGKPSFETVMAGLALLRKHRVDYNVLTTVHAANVEHPLEVYRFLRNEAGAQFIQFIPIVERENQSGFQDGHHVTRRSVNGREFGQFLISVFDEWVREHVGQVFVQLFDVALGIWCGLPASLCVFGDTCGTALAVEHNGDLYSCDHYVEPRCLLGNIQEKNMLEMVLSQKQLRFGLDKRDSLPQFCRTCKVRFACNGGCPKNRIRRTPDGEGSLNYLCDGYKAFFNHINEPMQEMARLLRMGRPPAEVMRA
jgi:uncharacterized protein